MVSSSDSLGRTTSFEYDDLDRLTRLTDPQGGTTRFSYDANGNPLSITDQNDNITTFEYDAGDRLISVTDPLLRERTLTYNSADRITQRVDRFGRETNFTYDAIGRVTQVSFADLTSIQYTYDAVGNLLEAVDSVGGPVTFAYDDLNRVIRQTMPTGTVEYTYEAAGRRESATVSGRDPITYVYDALGRLTDLGRGPDSVEFGYDAIGRLIHMIRSNGVESDLGYNDAHQITSIEHLLGGTPFNAMQYEYDSLGNRVRSTTDNAQPLASQSLDQTFGAANRLLTSGAATVEHDEEGNVIRITDPAGMTELTWDVRNRLTAVVGPSMTAEFTYGPFNRRLSKTIDGQQTQYLYDFGNVIQESRDGMVADYLPAEGLDAIFSRTDDSGTYFLLRDALGSVTALTDETGAIVNRYFYEPFGQTTVVGEAENPFQYTGRERDETGLYYYRTRYYDPELRRFLSKDPIGFAGSDINFYAYVLNNPTNLLDPEGKIIVAAVAAAFFAWSVYQAATSFMKAAECASEGGAARGRMIAAMDSVGF